jgi:hypothetical protein
MEKELRDADIGDVVQPPLQSRWQGAASAAIVLVLWPWLALSGAFQIGGEETRSPIARSIEAIRSLLRHRAAATS